MSLLNNLFGRSKQNDERNDEDVTIRNEPQMFFARLLFEDDPEFDDAMLEQELKTNFSTFTNAKHSSSTQYFFSDYMVSFQEGDIPAQCTVFKPDTFNYITSHIEKALQQVWHWPEAPEGIKNCKFELVANDFMALPLPYKQRVELFQKFLRSVATALKPKAIYFPISEKVVETETYLQQLTTEGESTLYGLLNVRLFNIQNGDLLMDSVGLHSMGLPDFQIRFKDYDPGNIAGLLYSYCHYIFDYGSVIKNGNTVEGIEEGSKWRCLYNKAALDPARNVLEVEHG